MNFHAKSGNRKKLTGS